METLARYAAPKEPGGSPAGVVVAPPPEPKKSRLGTWGRWYTWVAAGAVVALVVGVLITSKVGDDSLTVTATH